MGVPHRFDLSADSCVNKEVEVFNRKLGKLVKAFEHTTFIKSDIDRELFTKHGLHLNNKGKEMVTKKIIPTIKHLLYKKTEEPISMTWKQDKVKTVKTLQEKRNNLESEKEEVESWKQDNVKTSQEKHKNPESENGGADTCDDTTFQNGNGHELKELNQDATNTNPAQRLGKPPTTREDFFVDGQKTKKKNSYNKGRGRCMSGNNLTTGTDPLTIFHQNICGLQKKSR
jgi:hypothetical protein